MKVIILCGGLGTRLREETEYRPKPMVPIGDQPILWHIMKGYARYGFKEFVLCLGYKGEVIKDYFRNYLWNRSDVTLKLGRTPKIKYHNSHDEEDWTVTLVETGLNTQTGGRLKRAMDHIGDETVLMTYGDGLTDCNLAALADFHHLHDGSATLTAVRPAGRYGELEIEDSVIHSFQEKPEESASYVNGGFMVLDSRVRDLLTGDDCIFERNPLRELARTGQLRAFQHDGFWQCMDTYREQQILEKLWLRDEAPWKTW